jgi:ligand-binding sensor domain-containing protein/signal transduction histidine kinase
MLLCVHKLSIIFKSILSIALLLLILPVCSQAQRNALEFRHLGTSDGLSEGRIFCMLQDSRGFLWFGTYNGLNKYDGYSFKHYYAKPHDTSGLQSNVITALCEDSSHTIWIGTRGGGLCTLDRRTDRFHHYSYSLSDPKSLSSNDVTAILCDSKGRVWVGTTGEGLNYFNPAKGVFQRYSFVKSENQKGNPNNVTSLFETANGNIIVNASGVPSEFDPVTATSHQIGAPVGHSISSLRSIWSLSKKSGCLFVVATGYRSYSYIAVDLPKLNPIKRWQAYGMNSITKFVLQGPIDGQETGNSSTCLIGTSRGLFLLNSKDHSVQPFYVDSHDPGNTYSNVFMCALFDKQGRLWVGTYDGVYVLNRDALIFRKHFLGGLQSISNAQQTVRSLYADNRGNILAGTLSGKLFESSDKDREFRASAEFATSRISNPVNGITRDSAGNIWFVGTSGPWYLKPAHQTRLIRLTSNNTPCTILGSKYFHPQTDNNFLPPGGNGYIVYCDRQARIWLGTGTTSENEATLHCYNARDGTLSSFAYPGSGAHSGIHGVYCMLEDYDNNFWIGTAEGLFQFDRSTGRFKPFMYDPDNEHSINYNSITTLHEDTRGRLWVGTWGGGLDLMDRKSGQFTHFVEKDGLPSNIIYSILEDKAGSLWMATGRGISHFDADLRTFSNYDLEDGLLDNEFQPNAAAMLPSGEMFFGGNHGITSFFPERVAKRTPKAPLEVTLFNVSNKSYVSELGDGDTVRLLYDQNDLSFDFAALDFSSPAKKRYEYILLGEDAHWSQCGSRNTGAYNNLSPGHYILRIKSANAQGVWDASGIAINIIIATPYWGTWWFQLLVAFTVLVLMLAWVFRIRSRKRAYQRMLDHALENERVNIAGELHDGPLQDLYATRFLLEGQSSNLMMLERGPRDELEAILKKVRGDLRAVTGELQLPRFENGLSQELINFLEGFGEQNPEIQIVNRIQAQTNALSLHEQENLFRIVRTAVANVKRHAKASEIIVQFSQVGKIYEMDIADNGCGFSVPSTFDALGREKHYGLILMHAHAHEIGAKLSISSIPGKETRIHVTYLKRVWLGRANVLHRLFKA